VKPFLKSWPFLFKREEAVFKSPGSCSITSLIQKSRKKWSHSLIQLLYLYFFVHQGPQVLGAVVKSVILWPRSRPRWTTSPTRTRSFITCPKEVSRRIGQASDPEVTTPSGPRVEKDRGKFLLFLNKINYRVPSLFAGFILYSMVLLFFVERI